jgi:hypothetical protein
MRTLALLASGLLLVSPLARAHEQGPFEYFRSGEALLQECERKDSASSNRCEGYIAGVADAHRAISIPFPGLRRYCTPEHVTVHEIRRVVAKWLEANPAQLHSPASSLVVQALHDAFPCKETK